MCDGNDIPSKLHDWLNEIEVATTDCSLIDGSDELDLIDLIVYESIAINIIYCDIRCENLSSYSSVWSSEQTDHTQLYDSNPNEENLGWNLDDIVRSLHGPTLVDVQRGQRNAIWKKINTSDS